MIEHAESGGWVNFVIVLIIIAYSVITAIVKAAKKGDNGTSHQPADDQDNDLWHPQAKPMRPKTVPPPIPAQNVRRIRQEAVPPPLSPSVVHHPKGISQEAASSIRSMESSDDGFERHQDKAYDLESSDIPMSSEEAFSLTKQSRVSRKKHVKVNLRGKQLRNAIVVREILAPPRCFDI